MTTGKHWTLKSVALLITICLQGFIVYGSSTLSYAFYVKWLREERAVPSQLVGLYGAMPGIGSIIYGLFDFHDYLQFKKHMSLRNIQLGFLGVCVLAVSGLL